MDRNDGEFRNDRKDTGGNNKKIWLLLELFVQKMNNKQNCSGSVGVACNSDVLRYGTFTESRWDCTAHYVNVTAGRNICGTRQSYNVFIFEYK